MSVCCIFLQLALEHIINCRQQTSQSKYRFRYFANPMTMATTEHSGKLTAYGNGEAHISQSTASPVQKTGTNWDTQAPMFIQRGTDECRKKGQDFFFPFIHLFIHITSWSLPAPTPGPHLTSPFPIPHILLLFDGGGPHSLSPSPLRGCSPIPRYSLSLIHHVSAGLGASSFTEARQSSPVMGTGSTEIQQL